MSFTYLSFKRSSAVIWGRLGKTGFRNSLEESTLGHLPASWSDTQALGSQMGLSLNSGLFNLSELQNLYLELGTYTRTHKRVLMKVESVSVNYPDFHVSLSSESRGSAPSHSLLCYFTLLYESYHYMILSHLLINMPPLLEFKCSNSRN